MTGARERLCLTLVSGGLILACSQLSAADASLADRLDAIVDGALAEGFAGGVAVWRDGEPLYSRWAGFADAERTVPVTEATLFHVASITKYFTACLVLRAAEEGAFDLADPIDPWVGGSGLEGRGFTFEKLLAHQSGLGSSYAAESQTDAAAALAAVGAVPWDAEAAGRFRYSNDGYDVLGIVLERVYGRPYEALAREKLFTRAGIENVGFWGEAELTDPAVVGQPLRNVAGNLGFRNYGMIASAGLLITATELASFQAALVRGAVLEEASLRALWSPRGSLSLGRATFGAFLVESPVLGRALSARGYEDWGDNAILNHYLDRDLIVAVVTSRGPAEGQGEPFRSTISAAIERELK